MSAPARDDRGRLIAVTRVLRLIRLLETMRQPMAIDDVAKILQCCRRTVRRDLEVLERLGARVTTDRLSHNDMEYLCGVMWEKDAIGRPA